MLSRAQEVEHLWPHRTEDLGPEATPQQAPQLRRAPAGRQAPRLPRRGASWRAGRGSPRPPLASALGELTAEPQGQLLAGKPAGRGLSRPRQHQATRAHCQGLASGGGREGAVPDGPRGRNGVARGGLRPPLCSSKPDGHEHVFIFQPKR